MTSRTPLFRHLIQNDSNSAIPPRSVVEVTSVEEMAGDSLTPAQLVYHVNKYAGGFGVILVTGQTQIPQGSVTGLSPTGWVPGKSFGDAFSDDIIMAAYDSTAANPAVGEKWGPLPGAWTLGRGGIGFKCIGYDASSTTKVAIFKRESGHILNAKNTGTVTAGSLATPTSFTANIWLPTGSTAGTGFAVATQAGFLGITVYNIWPSIATTTTGLTCKIKPDGNRWILETMDCP